MKETIRGTALGGFLGTLIGFAVLVWLIEGTLLFPGDAVVFGAVLGAVVGGLCGWFWGEDFEEWVKDHFHWFR